MSRLNSVMGMLAAGGTLSAVSGAEAVTVTYAPGLTTYTYDYPITLDAADTPIDLVGASTPQFLYGDFTNLGAPPGYGGLLSTGFFFGGPSKIDLGLVFGYSVGTPALGSGGVKGQFENGSISKTSFFPYGEYEVGPEATSPPAGSDHYAYLVISDDAARPYLALADIDEAGTLDSIAVAVPEPQAWALMMAGLGVAGGALRTRRRRQLTAA